MEAVARGAAQVVAGLAAVLVAAHGAVVRADPGVARWLLPARVPELGPRVPVLVRVQDLARVRAARVAEHRAVALLAGAGAAQVADAERQLSPMKIWVTAHG